MNVKHLENENKFVMIKNRILNSPFVAYIITSLTRNIDIHIENLFLVLYQIQKNEI